MKFSVLTPVYLHSEKRRDDFARCIKSLENQTNKDFEHVVIDNGSKFEIPSTDIETKTIRMDRLERVMALIEGFKKADGEWFCLLDSDDEYREDYLEKVSEYIEEHPKSKMFNFGAHYIHTDGGSHDRGSFKPKKEKVGHEVFGSGNIVNGTFVFHRSVWEDLGDFPQSERLWNPWDFSEAFQNEFPETKQFFLIDHPDHPEGLVKELGNPWGQDHALFYRYTRKYHSIPKEDCLYVVHNR